MTEIRMTEQNDSAIALMQEIPPLEVIRWASKSPLEEALETRKYLYTIKYRLHWHFIELGRILCFVKERRHWDTLRNESWVGYLDEVGINKDQADKLMRVIKHLASLPFVSDEDMMKLGPARCEHLVGAARRGEITVENWPEIMALETDIEVRSFVGHNVDLSKTITCPHCGYEFTPPRKKGVP